MAIDYTKNYYEILTVPKNATVEEIVSAYKSQIKIFHPDNVCYSENLRKSYEEKFKEIQEAYDVLSDEQKRMKYDKLINNNNIDFGKDGFENKMPNDFWNKMAYASNNLYNANVNKIHIKNVAFANKSSSNVAGCLFIIVIIIVGFCLGFFF